MDYISKTVVFILKHPNKKGLMSLYQPKQSGSKFYKAKTLCALKSMIEWSKMHGREPFQKDDTQKIIERLRSIKKEYECENEAVSSTVKIHVR